MPLDPQASQLLAELKIQGAQRNRLSIEEIRKNKREQIPLAGQPEPVAHIEEQILEVHSGRIKVRIYRPHG